MKMTPCRRALDKIYKRRDRYDIPEWQRGEVWNDDRKKALIDSILRGWKLPKFYFVKVSEEDYEVVDGQQRLSSIYEFFANTLPLSNESAKMFGGLFYKDLKTRVSDAFDDFEIEFDEIEDANEEELKEFFQRLQQGLPLTSSEKLNSVHSNFRDFCRKLSKHKFFTASIRLADTRLAHFDIAIKAAAIEVDGIDTGLRYDDLKSIFTSQKNFSQTSAVAKRLQAALDFLASAFPKQNARLKNRTIVQSMITLACRIVENKPTINLSKPIAKFMDSFLDGLSHQVELGQVATDFDLIRFQRSISANVKAGARIRQEVLLRKAFLSDPKIADAFSPAAIATSGVAQRASELANDIAEEIGRLNTAYAHVHGEDLFKSTNKTIQALTRIGKPLTNLNSYTFFIDDLYFLFRESIGQRLADRLPQSFVDVNTLRTDLQHDVDHGDEKKIRSKRKKIGDTFEKYAGVKSPQLLDPERFLLAQANLLSALDLDLLNLAVH
jgi:hypothetical protein